MHYEINSKLIKENDIFIALRGSNYDGHDFIEEAINNGAIKIIGEKRLKIKNYKRVNSSHKYLTKVISKKNKKLSKNFKIIGITGTKGKTTTAMIIYQMLQKMGKNVAYIGTMGVIYNNNCYSTNNTTPDILSLNKILNKLHKDNIEYIIMEVSSHSLQEKRIKGLSFIACVYTNLSHDHLDYHHNMENYLKAKMKILKYLKGPIIINSDDKNYKSFSRKTNYFLVGTNGNMQINNYFLNQTNTIINFNYQYNTYTVAIPFVGKYNIYNYLCALGVMINIGYDLEDIINISSFLKPIKGRGELIKTNKGFIIIDYAHSPSSVESILKTYNELKERRIITIIGCGGNRDKTKRPIMANVACKYSDYAILTSDNPRNEDPMTILDDMTKDLTTKNYEVIVDRAKAIKKGIKMLKKHDYLLILGKGHENYQIIGNKKLPFSDYEEVLKSL